MISPDMTAPGFPSDLALPPLLPAARGIPIIKVAAKSEFRPEAKNLEESERLSFLDDEFGVSQGLDGQRVLIADDVFRSGTSMGAVASAARDAGAVKVYGICGVRTMRR